MSNIHQTQMVTLDQLVSKNHPYRNRKKNSNNDRPK